MPKIGGQNFEGCACIAIHGFFYTELPRPWQPHNIYYISFKFNPTKTVHTINLLVIFFLFKLINIYPEKKE